MSKIYVDMLVKMTTEGNIIPLTILWEDGRKFDIDKVLDARQAASLKAGGCGMRYLCRINGQERYVFLEEGKWFIEGD